MTNMATVSSHSKNLYKFLLLNQWIDCLGIWYVALDTEIKHGKILEHNVSLKIFAQKCSNDELGLILIFLLQD